MQRVFDIFFAGLALLFLSPLFLLLILILRLTGEGEIFFLQERIGRQGEKFKLFKFATMLKASPSIGTGTVTVKDDPRILPIGGFLRKTKINELPQLINIVKGEMSLIGPRPQTPRCFSAFPISLQDEIKKVKPGLSGIGSIIFRGEEEMMHADADPDQLYDQLIMPYKGRLEGWFAVNQSIPNYFILIALTLLVVIIRRPDVAFRLYPSLPRPPKALKPFIFSDYYE
jgi:lipopolysaccharide/colanic/teichoic acid biosynthesis glycosyltransferase